MDFLGDPGSIDGVASELTAAHGALARTQGEVSSAVSRLVGGWQGSAASAFQGHWGTEGTSIDALAGVAARMASILTQLASELRRARGIAQQAEGIAGAHGLAIGMDGQVGPPLTAGPFGLPPNPAQEQARAQAQRLMNEALGIAHGAQSRAAGELSGLSVPQVLPGVSPQAAATWAQGAMAGRPGAPLSFGADLWRALRGNALPPSSMGDLGLGLWSFGRGLSIAGGTSSWMTRVVFGRFAPRDPLGRFVSTDVGWWQKALQSTQGKNWIANPYMGDTRAAWATAGRWVGRAGGVLAVGMSGLSQWMQDASRPGLNTDQRVSRAAYRGVVAGGAAWGGAIAGSEAGAAIGSFVGPEGTVIGGIIGGIVGGVVGSGVGNWVVDHTVNAVGDAGSTVIHEAGHLLSDLNPF